MAEVSALHHLHSSCVPQQGRGLVDWGELPADLCFQIFARVQSMKDLLSCRGTCRQWKVVAEATGVGRKFLHRKHLSLLGCEDWLSAYSASPNIIFALDGSISMEMVGVGDTRSYLTIAKAKLGLLAQEFFPRALGGYELYIFGKNFHKWQVHTLSDLEEIFNMGLGGSFCRTASNVHLVLDDVVGGIIRKTAQRKSPFPLRTEVHVISDCVLSAKDIHHSVKKLKKSKQENCVELCFYALGANGLLRDIVKPLEKRSCLWRRASKCDFSVIAEGVKMPPEES